MTRDPNEPDTSMPHNWRLNGGRLFSPPKDDGPRSDLARYAFGWSDKKPDAIFWLIIGGMFAYVVYRFATL